MYKLAISFSLILAVIGYFFYAENRIDSLQKKLENEENITKNLKKKIEIENNLTEFIRIIRKEQLKEETELKGLSDEEFDNRFTIFVHSFNGM